VPLAVQTVDVSSMSFIPGWKARCRHPGVRENVAMLASVSGKKRVDEGPV
jgi:hypothetical protein